MSDHPPSLHLLENIVFEVSTNRVELARKLNRELGDSLKKTLSNLEDFLDRTFPPDQTLRLEQVEIDLGRVSSSELPATLKEAMQKTFTSIRDKASTQLPSSPPLPERFSKLAAPGYRKENLQATVSTIPDSVEARSSPTTQRECLLYFLKHGYLPWWGSQQSWSGVTALQAWPDSECTLLRESLHSLILERPEILQRILAHLPIRLFVRHIVPPLRDFSKKVDPIDPRIVEDITHWMSLFRWIASNDFSCQNTQTIKIAAISKRNLPAVQTLLSLLPAQLRSEDFFVIPLSKDRSPSRQSFAKSGSQQVAETDSSRQPQPSDEVYSATEDRLAQAAGINGPKLELGTVENGLHIDNAGLVLLHPFLDRFFRAFDWVDDKGRLGDETRWIAVQALQHLCRGESGLPEHTLILEKTLCGIPLKEIAGFPKLDSRITSECNELLKAAIKHWSILKRTSPEGLRESFLLRKGLLFLGEESIQLRVEHRAFDLLLGHLPWPMTPIKLPWMPLPIHLHWPTSGAS